MKTSLVMAVVAVGLVLPMDALACPVCMDDDDANRVAYIAMTALLTTLPFLIVGSLGFYIWKKGREADNEVV